MKFSTLKIDNHTKVREIIDKVVVKIGDICIVFPEKLNDAMNVVAAIPEGLPLTVTLAYYKKKMMREDTKVWRIKLVLSQ